MNLSQLEVVVAIVDTGSLTAAAEKVGLTQSAVSYSLSRLEAELGVTLLERNRQGVLVTQIGKEVIQHARMILGQIEVIRQKTNRERGLSSGKVRFGVVPDLDPRLLTGTIRQFQHKYPEIEIVLFEGNPHELLEWLETGVIDVGTVLDPKHYKNTVEFVSAEIKMLVPEKHPLAEKSSVSIAALAEYPLIGPRSQYRMFNDMLAGKNIPAMPPLRYEASSRNTIMTMVRENMGVSMMPETLYDGEMQGIVAISFDPPLHIKVYLATHVESPISITFMKHAHNRAKEHGFFPDKT